MNKAQATKHVKSKTWTKAELLDVVNSASLSGPSKMNSSLSKNQAVGIVRRWAESLPDGDVFVPRGHNAMRNLFVECL